MNIEHRRIPVSKSLAQCCLSYMHIHNILDQTPFSALRCWALRPGGVWRPSYMGCLYRRRPASSWIFIRWISCNSQQSVISTLLNGLLSDVFSLSLKTFICLKMLIILFNRYRLYNNSARPAGQHAASGHSGATVAEKPRTALHHTGSVLSKVWCLLQWN